MSNDAEMAEVGQRPTLFLSYAHADQRRAKTLAAALGAAGYTVWWDALIEGGAAFARTINVALDKADAVIVLWSATSIDSDWVCDEAASGRDRKRLVPLSLDGTLPPLGFRQYHAIDLSHWKGRAGDPEMAAIERAIAATCAGETARTSSPSAPVASPGLSRRSVGLLLGSAVVAAGGGAIAWRQGWLGAAQLSKNSIAVLPLKNLAGNADQSYFSDGLTEELRTALRRIDALQVVAATSSDSVRDSKDDAPTIAGRLGVAFLLSGAVQRAADTVRISLELVDASSGFSRWSNQFDRKLTDIFAVQSEIALTVAQALSVQIATATPAPGGTQSVEAYEHFLHGRALFDLAKDEPTDRAGLAELDLAIAADPQFALAHAARARSIIAIAGEYAKAAQLKPLYDMAIRAAQRAIDIAPDLPEGQVAMGQALFIGRLNIPAARPFFDQAAQLGRGNADILLMVALYDARAGRASEARAAITRAIALDPLNPRAFRAAASIEYAARRYRAVIAPATRALELNPNMANSWYLIGYARMLMGDLAGAKAALTAEPHAVFRLSGLAIVADRTGDKAGARQAYGQLVRDAGNSGLYQQAQVLAQWGDREGAFAVLNQARSVHDSGLIYLASDPLLDPLRADPRFAALRRGLATG